jgi:hypothetical protein
MWEYTMSYFWTIPEATKEPTKPIDIKKTYTEDEFNERLNYEKKKIYYSMLDAKQKEVYENRIKKYEKDPAYKNYVETMDSIPKFIEKLNEKNLRDIDRYRKTKSVSKSL